MVACEQIVSFKEFINSLISSDRREYASLFKALDIPLEDYLDIAVWNSDDYSRICLERNEKFELILLCWTPHTSTPIHDHDGQSCWVYQVEGEIEETRYEIIENKKPAILLKNTLQAGQLTYMDDKMGFHSLHNPTHKKALTFHLYVNPIDKCAVYNKKEDELKIKSLTYCKDLQSTNFN